MVEGIIITSKEFSKLPRDEQNLLLFQNTQDIKLLIQASTERFLEHEKRDWYHQKITYTSIIALASILGVIKFVVPLFS